MRLFVDIEAPEGLQGARDYEDVVDDACETLVTLVGVTQEGLEWEVSRVGTLPGSPKTRRVRQP